VTAPSAIASALDRARLARLADGLAVAVAVALPWWTTPTNILIVLWLLALLPTLDVASVRRELATPAGGLPVALWLLAALGMLWADVPWAERIAGLGAFHKLLIVPLLLAQFRRSGRGLWVAGGFFAACVVLLVASWALALLPALSWRSEFYFGVPTRDYIAQSGEFAICAFALFHLALDRFKAGRRLLACGLVILAFVFLADIAYVATSRTVLVVIPVLLVVVGMQRFGWRGTLVLIVGAAVVAAAAWFSSSYLRARVTSVTSEIALYDIGEGGPQGTSSGMRIAFWKKSVEFIRQAPVLGHGTGSVPDLFRRSVAGRTGADSVATVNPHQQTLAVAVQLGIVGAIVLWAMWVAHLLLFRARTLVAWLGLIVVVQNVVSSLFNSHIGDFAQGWTYVFAIGALGGTVLRGASAGTGR
jgi:O-antigen ligase